MTKIINNTLKNTWETLDNIIVGYYDNRDIFGDKTELYLNYLDSIDEFDKKVFLLYAEYNSYRKVAKETNRSYFIISQIVNKVREELVKL